MDFLQYRVKNMEAFKDGTILNGRFLKPGEILVVSESDFVKITNSGGTLEILDTLIPNPKRIDTLVREVMAEQEAKKEEQEKVERAVKANAEESLQRAGEPAPKKRGRPRKVVDDAS